MIEPETALFQTEDKHEITPQTPLRFSPPISRANTVKKFVGIAISAIIVIALAVTVWVNHLNKPPEAKNPEADNRVSNASEIIKESIRSPSSFSIVSGKEVWSGKNTEGNAAYIVRVEFDAQNGFGAMIRGCKIVAYYTKGNKIEWRPFGGVDNCATQRHESRSAQVEMMMQVEIMRKYNFEKPPVSD